MHRYLTPFTFAGTLSLVIGLAGWIAFPGWQHMPGGIIVLMGISLVSVGIILKDLPFFRKANLPGATEIHPVRSESPAGPPIISLLEPHSIFVGREKILEKLVSQQDGQARLFMIYGPAGGGKTEFARALAQRLSVRFPFACLEIDLAGFGPRNEPPVSSEEAMRRLLTLLHPGVPLSAGEEELERFYRDSLLKHKTLLLLDNAYNAAQVLPLLPPAPSAAIITSRACFAIPETGLSPYLLEPLEPVDARLLLGMNLPGLKSVPIALLKEIADWCERLPLTLRLAGAILQTHLEWNAKDLLEHLQAESTSLCLHSHAGYPDLKARSSLAVLYTALGDSHLERLRFLSVFPDWFKVEAAAVIWVCPPIEARNELDYLCKRGLVDCREDHLASAEPSSIYRLNELVRESTAEDLCRLPDQVISATRRHALYYQEQGLQAENLFRQRGEAAQKALRQFHRLWPHLDAAWRRMSGLIDGWPQPEEADTWLSEFPGQIPEMLSLHLAPENQVQILQAALLASQRSDNQAKESIYLGNLGSAYHLMGDRQQAACFYELSLKLDRQLQDHKGECTDLANLGQICLEQGETGQAAGYYRQQLAIALELGDLRKEADALSSLGKTCLAAGEPGEAMDYFQQSLQAYRHVGYRGGESSVLSGLGNACANQGLIPRALEYYRQALQIDRLIKDHHGEGADLGNLGLAYADMGKFERAIEHFNQAIAITHQIGEKDAEAAYCWHKAQACEKKGDLPAAFRSMQDCVEIEQLNDLPGVAGHLEKMRQLKRKLQV